MGLDWTGHEPENTISRKVGSQPGQAVVGSWRSLDNPVVAGLCGSHTTLGLVQPG